MAARYFTYKPYLNRTPVREPVPSLLPGDKSGSQSTKIQRNCHNPLNNERQIEKSIDFSGEPPREVGHTEELLN
jgi:hypothetical protein